MKKLKLPNGERINYIDKLTARYVYDEIYRDNIYLQFGINIKDNDTVLDVGANIGLFTRFILQQAQNLKIYAFEPITPIFKVLKLNTINLPAEIHLFNFGLGEKEIDLEFNYYPKVSGDSAAIKFNWDFKVSKFVEHYNELVCKEFPIARLIPKKYRKRVVNSGLKKVYQAEKVMGKIKTLSKVIEENNIEQIDLLKIDAENYEKYVLAGIDVNDWPKIRQISMEVHTHVKGEENLLDEISSSLEQKGYEIHRGGNPQETLQGVYMLYALKK